MQLRSGNLVSKRWTNLIVLHLMIRDCFLFSWHLWWLSWSWFDVTIWARTWSTWKDQSDHKQKAVLLNIQCQIMHDKEDDISEKTMSLKNNYKNSLNDIDDNSDISSILISSSSMMHLSVLSSSLSEKNLTYELVSGIMSSSPVRARVAHVKKIC